MNLNGAVFLSFRRTLVVLASVFSLLAVCGYAQQTSQLLNKHVPSVVSSGNAAQMGALPSTQKIQLTIVLTLRNQVELKRLLSELYDPSNPNYHHFLTVQEFTDQFSPTTQDYESVITWAGSRGLAIENRSKNRLTLDVVGTVAQVNAALDVRMNVYRDEKENREFYSIDREPTLNLAVPVAYIQGLNNHSIPRPMVKLAKNFASIADVTGSGPGGYYLGSDMRAAYYAGTLLTGSGQSVGLLEFGGYRLSDVNLTFNNAGQSNSVPINNVLIDGASAEAGSDDTEQVLDIVQTIGMAPGLSQVRVYIGNGGYDADIFNSMATENICKQLSVSWSWSPVYPSSDDGIFQEFAAQGQSVFVSSGDDGAYDASISPYFYPAEDDYVTSVGGTHLTTDYGGGPWVAESAWNNPPYGSGGGVSPDGFLMPSWQQGVATYNNGGSAYLRNVPDVAMEADLDNYYCTLGVCQGGAGGTSFAAPRWAGFMALINEQATETGKAPTGGLGFINPAIYSIGEGTNYNTDFHDIAAGNNDSDNQPVWYNALTGYDLVTGWGSPSGQGLIDALASPIVSGFWLLDSPGALAVAQNSSGTTGISVTDAGGFTGNVSLTASGLPSGVTASFNPSTTTGTSVLTLTASSSATVGPATVTITGTSGSLSSKASLFLSVNAPTVQPPPVGSFGSTNIGSTSSATALTLTFTTAGTLATIGVLTQGISNLDFANASGGTCSVGTSYVVNASCTVNVMFTPKFAGARYGAVMLEDASGNQLAKVYLEGTGVGPQATFIPGTQTSIGSGFIYPDAAATLADGSVYVTDHGSGNGTGALYLEKFSNGTYTQSKVNCTFTTPAGVAVDGSGTVYVADPGVPAVYKVIVLSNGTCSLTTIGSGFGTPWSVAVDGTGDVYVTDLGSSTLAASVYKETLQTTGSYVQSAVGTGWISPSAIAVDSKGNVEIADGAIPGVFIETPSGGSYTQTPVGAGWSAPSGVAIDGSGNIYIADAGNSIVYGGSVPAGIYKETPSGGSYVQTAIGSGWVIPRGIAVDAGGNIYVPDQTRGVFKEDLADPPTLGFASAPASTVSNDSPKTEIISNIGSAALQFSSLNYPSDFPEVSGISTDCAASTSVPAGASCTLSIEFLPTTALGANISLPLNESVNLTTNTLNTTTQQSVTVGGTELLPGGSVALNVSPDPAAAGTIVIFTATVVSSTGGPTPTGTITFYNGATPIAGPLALSNGAAAYSTTSLPIGIYSIVASYSGDANYQASNSNAISESVVAAQGTSSFGNTSIGNQNVGSTSSAIPLSITFTVPETLGSISVLTEGAPNLDFANTGGGTCSVGTAYAANTTCTVNVTFAPKFSGTRYGAVVLADNNGNVIGTGYLEGTGVSPQTAFLPGTLTSPISSFGYPVGVAVDGSSNLFVADASNAAVYKETLTNGIYSQTTVGSGFGQPYGVAVDGAGNIYVSDVQNHAVYMETPSNGSYIQTIIGYGFISPMGVAVDALGNVYVADFGNGVNPGAVYLEAVSNASYTQSTIGTGFVSPQSVAVDGSGNVYIADSANGNGTAAVYKLTPANGSYNQIAIGSGWTTPTGVAVDSVGNIYVTDDAYDLGYGFVLKEALQSDGSYLPSTLLGSTKTPYPGGIAVDGAGNLYVTDNFDGILYRDDVADPPVLSFATTVVGTTSSDSPKTVTVQNAGNAVMNFSALSYPADFPEAPGIPTDCTSSTSLGIGTACTLSIDFKPASLSGTNQSTLLSENVSITTNSLSVGSRAQAVAVSGTEAAPLATVVLSVPASIATVGTSITFTATVTGQNGVTAPTGSVSFYANGATLGTSQLNNGIATYSTNSLAVGTYSITATYSGDQNYSSASSNTLIAQIINTSTFGTQNIGSTSSSSTLTITFASRVTLGSIAVVTQGVSSLDFINAGGGTCATGTAYTTGATCTVKVAFKPLYPGSRYGAIVLGDNKGNLIQTIYLQGSGVGPQISFSPATPSTITTLDRNYPVSAVDGSGNVYFTQINSSGTYVVNKLTLSGGHYTQSSVSTATTLHRPSQIVVDGSGAVYILDYGQGKNGSSCVLLKESLVVGAYKESSIQSTTTCNTSSFTVDGSGNLYRIASRQVVKDTLSGSTYTTTAIPTGTLYAPSLGAIDSIGNVYLSDFLDDVMNESYLVRILKEAPTGTSYTESVIASQSGNPVTSNGYAYGAPTVDPNGDVYFVSESAQGIIKATPMGSGYSLGAASPSGEITGGNYTIGLDGAQNLYVLNFSNNTNQLLKLDSGDAPSLVFSSTAVGLTSTDSPKVVTISDVGNAALTFAPPSSGTNPSISSNFSLNSMTTCPQIVASGSPIALNPDSSCTYDINFTPTATGTINGSLVVTDNTLNTVSGTQTIPLSGTGIAGGGEGNVVMAMLTIGPDGKAQGVVVPNVTSPADASDYAKVWVDTTHSTFINGFIFLQVNSQGQLTCSVYSTANVTAGPQPQFGSLSYSTENYYLGGDQCPGILFPFRVARYTWNSKQAVDQDPFVLQVRDNFGVYLNEYGFAAELSQLANSHAVWNACGDPNSSLPTTATLTLKNPPPNATSFDWTITAPQNKMIFLNGQKTISTTAPSTTIKGLDASGARNDISLSVVAKGVPFSTGLNYGPLKTWIRRPNQLQLLNPTVFGTQDDVYTFAYGPGFSGYETDVDWQVNDQFGGNTYNTNQASVEASELVGPFTTPSGSGSSYPGNNWATTLPAYTDSGWTAAACVNNTGACFSGGGFIDHLSVRVATGNTQVSPTPENPPANGDTFSTQLVGTKSQIFYAGDGIEGPDIGQSPAPYQGCEVQTDTIYFGIDHATENATTTTSPVLSQPVDNYAALVQGRAEPVASTSSTDNSASPAPSNMGLVVEVPNSGAMMVPQGMGSVLGSVPDIGFLARNSTLIIKGTVVETHAIGSGIIGASVLSEMSATIQAEGLLKGKIEGGMITVKYSVGREVYGIWLNRGDYALFFLKGGQDGKYSFADPITARMPITRQRVSTPVDAQDPTDRLEAELYASLSDPDRNVAITALKQIGNLGHGDYGVKPNVRLNTIRTLGEIAAAGDPESRGLAYTALINLENYSFLQPAIEFAENSERSQAGGIVGAISEIGDVRLREAKRATDDPDMECPSKTDLPFDKSVLPLLHTLLSSPDVVLRRSAAHALRGICDPSSASFLVDALNDSDRKIQYDALQGLAALEDFPVNYPAPTISDFIASPAKYLENWKSWWEKVGMQKYTLNR